MQCFEVWKSRDLSNGKSTGPGRCTFALSGVFKIGRVVYTEKSIAAHEKVERCCGSALSGDKRGEEGRKGGCEGEGKGISGVGNQTSFVVYLAADAEESNSQLVV